MIQTARAYLARGNRDKALEFFERARALKPDNKLILRNLQLLRSGAPLPPPAPADEVERQAEF